MIGEVSGEVRGEVSGEVSGEVVRTCGTIIIIVASKSLPTHARRCDS